MCVHFGLYVLEQFDDAADNNEQTAKLPADDGANKGTDQPIAESHGPTSWPHCYANELSVCDISLFNSPFLWNITQKQTHLMCKRNVSRNPVLSSHL